MRVQSVMKRSRIVYWLLLAISLTFIVTGIGILLFSDIPQFEQFLWAAGLGLAAALMASDNAKPREPDDLATSELDVARLRRLHTLGDRQAPARRPASSQ